jgi:two-component system response regulator RegA
MNRLLLVEDDLAFGDLLMGKFLQLGWQIVRGTTVDSVAEVLVKNEPFSHCLLDLNLNSKNGMTVLPEILVHSPSCKVVVLTGYASVHSGIEAIKLGAVYLLQKPSRLQDILDAFDHVANPEPMDDAVTHPSRIAKIEDELIQRTLSDNQFNVSKTAAQLGLHRRTLQRKMKKRLGL